MVAQTKEIQVLIDLEINKAKAAKAMADIRKYSSYAGTQAAARVMSAKEAFAKVHPEIKRLNKELESMGTKMRPFQGWALSIMFGAMAINRFLISIQQQSKKTFQEVMASVEGATTAFTILDGAIKYVQFAIGSALNEVIGVWIPAIIALSTAIGNWILENENLVASLIIIATIVTGVIMFIGGLTLFVWGLAQAVTILGIVSTSAAANMTTFGIALKGLSFITAITGIMTLLVWLGLFTYRIGGFLELLKSIARGATMASMVIGAFFRALAVEFFNFIKISWNTLVDGVNWSVNLVIKGVNEALKAIERVTKIKIKPVDYVNFSALKVRAETAGSLFGTVFGESMYESMTALNKLIPLKKGYPEMTGMLGLPEYPATTAPVGAGAAAPAVGTQNITNNFDITVKETADFRRILDEMKKYTNTSGGPNYL